jgi:hypothetical protein
MKRMQTSYELTKRELLYLQCLNGKEAGTKFMSQALYSNGIRSIDYTQCKSGLSNATPELSDACQAGVLNGRIVANIFTAKVNRVF